MSKLFLTTALLLGCRASLFAAEFTHTLWDQLLQKHVVDGRVDYAGFDRVELRKYLAELAALSMQGMSREAQLALWINAYNAYTVELILDNYPISSIKKIPDPWGTVFCKVAGSSYSLDQIEHEILRKRFKEPRIHFAIVCASISCPPLAARAYSAQNVLEMLEKQTAAFFGKSINLKIEKGWLGSHKLYTTKILKWFGEDFGTSKRERVTFIKAYAPAAIRRELEQNPDMDLAFLFYDWGLNGR